MYCSIRIRFRCSNIIRILAFNKHHIQIEQQKIWKRERERETRIRRAKEKQTKINGKTYHGNRITYTYFVVENREINKLLLLILSIYRSKIETSNVHKKIVGEQISALTLAHMWTFSKEEISFFCEKINYFNEGQYKMLRGNKDLYVMRLIMANAFFFESNDG